VSDEHGSSGPETSISKSEFARRRNVTPGRVTQWIDEGKISGAALMGEGRTSRIFESIAVDQLRRSLDIHQRLGNGGATHLNLDPPAPAAPRAPGLQLVQPSGGNVLPLDRQTRQAPPAKATTQVDEVGEAIRREQLEALQRKNRREAIDEEAQSGRFTDADASRQEMGRLAARLVTGFEGSLPELASAIAGHFKLPQRDVLHVLRGAYRDARAKQADAAKTAAAAVPEFVEAEVEIEREPEPA
jgi:hypothetical protein